MSESIATEAVVTALAMHVAKQIRAVAHKDPSFKVWTRAVWQSLKDVAEGEVIREELPCPRHWSIFPAEGPYKGEFLVDFVLWEKGYGPRIVCESQWLQRYGGVGAIEWAFDKLRCVKGDIKLLIYEHDLPPNGSRPPDTVARIFEEYIRDLKLISTEEAFLFVHLSDTHQWAHWWKPEGMVDHQHSTIEFKQIRLS